LPELDFDTMQEMAESGAKVLNARAVEWAKRQNIAIYARKTEDLGHGRETRVQARGNPEARAIVVDKRVALLRVPAAQAAQLLACCAEGELELRDSAFSDGSFCAVLPLTALPSPEAALTRLRETVAGLEISQGLVSVSLVGVGVGAEPRELAMFLEDLGTKPPLLLASPLRVSALVPEASAAAAERALHARQYRS
jgi:aspartate kinase